MNSTLRFFIFAAFFALASVGFISCDKDEETITIDTALPQGDLSVGRTGTIVEQNSTGSQGGVRMVTDAENTAFLQFENDFTTNFGTGTVSVYLSTSADFVADPANGNPDLRLVGPVFEGGENFFKLDPVATSEFTHVILWCGSANIPFGYAALQ